MKYECYKCRKLFSNKDIIMTHAIISGIDLACICEKCYKTDKKMGRWYS